MAVGVGITGMVQAGAGDLAGAGAVAGTALITEAGIIGTETATTTTTPTLMEEEATTPTAASEETIIIEEILQEAIEVTMLTILLEEVMPTILPEIRRDTTRAILLVTTLQIPEITALLETAITLQEIATTTIILQHETATLQEAKT